MPRHILFLAFLAFVVLAVSCGGESSLRGTYWNLLSMDTFDGPDITPHAGVALEFSEDGNGFSGGTACNTFGGTYRIEGSLFRVVDLWWTEAGCPSDELFEQEQFVQQVLSDAYEYFLEGEELTIMATDGRSLTFLQ